MAVDHTVSRQTFHIVSCANCGFAWTDPRPTASAIGAYYDSPEYISHSNTKRSTQDRLYHLVRNRAIRGKHKLLARYVQNGRVLDVGCGTGAFLGYLKARGYLPQGTEPNTLARETAIAEQAIEVLPSVDAIPAHEQFRAITMWHVLEHVHDPRATLKKIHARMCSGGLLMVAVPDRESWDRGHYGSLWAAWDVPRHLSHFRRQDIRHLLEGHGFELVDTRPMWFDAFYVSMLSERNQGRGPIPALVFGALWGSLSNLFALAGIHPTSSTLYIAKKA